MGKGFVSKHVPGSYAFLRDASAEVQAVVDATEGILRTGDLHLRPGDHTRFIPIHDHFNHFPLKFNKIQNKSDLNRITIVHYSVLYSISPRISKKFSKHGIFPNYPNPMFEKWPWSGHATRKTGSCNVGLAVSSEAKQARRVAGMIWPPPRRSDEHIRGMGYDGIHLVDCLSDYSDWHFCWPISSYFREYLEQLYWRLSTGFINVLKDSSFPVLLGVKQGEPPNIIIKLIKLIEWRWVKF